MSNYWDKFKNSYNQIDAIIEDSDYLAAYEQLEKLCSEYDQVFGSNHFGLISAKLTLAELCVKIGEEKYGKSIEILEQVIDSLGEVSLLPDDLTDIYYFIIDKLSSLYSLTGAHKKSIEMSMILVENLLKDHSQENGEIITQNNMSFEEKNLNQLISRYLGIGASYSRLGEYLEARKNLEKGYFISHTYYGDKDERTLKLNYNLAANEMQGIDFREGLRQLRFVYKDMQNYLGVDNVYTQKAKEVLLEIGEDVS